MPERKTRTKPKLVTQTAKDLKPAPPVVKPLPAVSRDDAINTLLAAIYQLALEGNTAAAKIYLDYAAKRSSEDENTLSADDAIKLLQEHVS
jgi:hypothetical protein